MDYARAVDRGEEPAGPLVRAACRRHLEDFRRNMTRGYRLRRGARMYFSLERYEHFRDFAERIRLWQGQFYGEPVVLHPMQEFIFGNLFGWRAWREGEPTTVPAKWPRRFRRAYLEIGKGNSKTPSMGLMALYGLCADGEPGAEVYMGAAKRDQAQICMTDVAEMARVSALPDLRYTGVVPTYGVTHWPTKSRARLLSRDSGKTESGIKPHMAFLDEVHEHTDGRLVSMVTRGFKFRRQPLLVLATNSGYSDVDSVALEEHEAATKLLTGEYKAEDSFAYVCGLDAGDDPFTDEGCWRKANPMLGVSQSVQALRDAVQDAGMYPSRRADVDRLHFCRWSGISEATWMAGALWNQIEVDDGIAALAGGDVVLGVDLSESGDMTALSWMGAVDWTDDGRAKFHAVTWTYLPADGLRERADRDRRPYLKWVEERILRTTDGHTVEYADVADEVVDAIEGHELNVLAVVYDGWRFTRFHEALDLAGMPQGMAYVDHPQGFGPRATSKLRMGASLGFLERIIQSRRLTVERSPVLRSAAAGAVMRESDTGQKRWTKSASHVRIDALVALTMAAGACEWLWQEQEQEHEQAETA